MLSSARAGTIVSWLKLVILILDVELRLGSRILKLTRGARGRLKIWAETNKRQGETPCEGLILFDVMDFLAWASTCGCGKIEVGSIPPNPDGANVNW